MTVYELNKAQLSELKQRYLDNHCIETEGRNASFDELADADKTVSDDVIFESYEDFEFSEDDFFAESKSTEDMNDLESIRWKDGLTLDDWKSYYLRHYKPLLEKFRGTLDKEFNRQPPSEITGKDMVLFGFMLEDLRDILNIKGDEE